MRIESDGHSRGNPRLFEVIENAPKVGKSPTVWAWPELIDHLRVAAQPVQGPWPPHQEPRAEPEEDMFPVAVADPIGVMRNQRTTPRNVTGYGEPTPEAVAAAKLDEARSGTRRADAPSRRADAPRGAARTAAPASPSTGRRVSLRDRG